MNISTRTIAALASPPGRGALAVIRLSGDGAHGVFAGVIREKEKFINEPARRICVYTIIDDETDGNSGIIDEVTAIKYDAPRSFTGEDMVEIFCHGGAIIPVKILDRLFKAGAAAAGRGEFSRRAFVNGKMDLLKAESIMGLIDSQTEKRLKSAQLAYQGKQQESLERLKREIISILSDIESRIEFGEDDDVAESEASASSRNRRELGRIVQELEEELRRSDRVKTLDEGILVALAGPPNAGKSSLFNEILGYDRSIVHDLPGTTRDVVSEKIVFEGVTVKLFDCAGIRDTADTVERYGIERTMSAVKDAHLVFWVTSADEPFGDDERQSIAGTGFAEESGGGCRPLVIINKIDLADIDNPMSILAQKKKFCENHSLKYVETSLTEKINADNLFESIKTSVKSVSEDVLPPELIINQRHRGIIESVVFELNECIAHFEREELSAHYLKRALDSLAEFLGAVDNDEVLNEIFGKFCVGK
jgi:tRNA modification GTPase